MARWGNELYESDQSLDYQSTIMDVLEREIAYLMTPERISSSTYWLLEMLGIVEMTLLFDQHESHSTTFLNTQLAVQRWRDTFLSVWDGDWQGNEPFSEPLPFTNLDYRRQYRPVVIAIFKRLESIAHFWSDIDIKGQADELTRSPLDYQLPYFSLTHWTNEQGYPVIYAPRIALGLIAHLAKDVIYWLSLEKRGEMFAFNATEVWVAVDLLAFLCEAYECTPLVTAPMVHAWRETTAEIWRHFLEGGKQAWDAADPLYLNIMLGFDRLEGVAERYPPEWYPS